MADKHTSFPKLAVAFALLLSVTIPYVLHVWQKPATERQAANEAVLANSERFVKEAFATFVMVDEPMSDEASTPALRWRGDTSKVIAVVSSSTPSPFPAEPVWTVYAVTSKGRYFVVDYGLGSLLPSDKQGQQRLSVQGFHPVTARFVKAKLLDAKLEDVARQWFGDTPAKVDEDA